MRKKKLLFFLFVLMQLFWTSGVQATGKITMTTDRQPGQSIEMHLKARGEIVIEGVNESGKQGYGTYTLTSSDIVIHGDITFFACNDNELTALDISQCTTIDTLQVVFNNLKTLDLSANKNLRKVFCYENQLEELTLGELPEVQELLCHTNRLKSINLTGLKKLRKCWISENQIESVDLSSNQSLEEFYCDYTPVSSLNLSNNKTLKRLNCSMTKMSSVNVKDCPDLEILYCSGLNIDKVDLSNNKKLKEYAFYSNNFTEADFSGLPDICYIECYSNSIDEGNMNKLVSSLPTRQAKDNARLVVINTQASKENNVCSKSAVAVAKDKGWKVQDYANGAFVPYEGSEGGGGSPEEHYVKLTTNKPAGTELTFYASALNPISVEGAEVLEAAGTKLRLKVQQPEITVKGDLMTFAAQKSGITSAELKSELLLSLWLDENELESINLNGNTTLLILNVEKNKLKTLDVSSLVNMEKFACAQNQLETLDLSGCSSLKYISCENNRLESLDFSKTPLIGSIACFGNKISSVKARAFFESLPECQTPVYDETQGGILFVNSHDSSEGNSAFMTDVDIAKNKKFAVIDYIGGTAGIHGKPYEGIGEQEEIKLYVGGVQVTAGNAGDVLDDGGTVTYDMASKTLTLNNARFTAPEGSGGIANSSVDDLTIRLVGDNSVTSQGSYTGMGLSRRTKITGEGKLTINGGSGGIYVNKTQLTVENCTVEVNGKVGIVGYDGKSGEELIVDNATLKVTGEKGAAFFLGNIETKRSMFDPQYGVRFEKAAKAVVNANGDLYMGTFAIIPDPTGVSSANVDAEEVVTVVYDVQGRSFNELQRGLNIVKMSNGKTKKVMVK